jgi:hypothetical protein
MPLDAREPKKGFGTEGRWFESTRATNAEEQTSEHNRPVGRFGPRLSVSLSILAKAWVPSRSIDSYGAEQVAKDVDLAFRLKARFPTVAHMTSVVANAIDGANSFTLGPPCRDLVPLPVAA